MGMRACKIIGEGQTDGLRVLILLAARDFESERGRGELACWRTPATPSVSPPLRGARRGRRDDADRQGLDPWGVIPLLRKLPLIRTLDAGQS